MNSKLPRLNRGGSPAPAILAFMGMAGGAYYLYKQKGADNPPRIPKPDSNPDSMAKNDLPGDHDTKLQDSLWSRMQGIAQHDPRTKDLTKPTATKDSSEK